jgi:hypothetical protein
MMYQTSQYPLFELVDFLFRVMDTLLPLDASAVEDSSTKYRLAAKIGETSGSTETCAKYYTLCSYSSSQIISLGNQVEASQQDQGQEQAQASENVAIAVPGPGTQIQLPVPVPKQSMSMSVSSSSSSSSVTAMPRV